MKIRPVILCGGSGTRLWPLSSDAVPKQLLSLVGCDSLLQATVKRVSGELFEAPTFVTRNVFVEAIAEQVAAIGATANKILVEPAPRNTAAAIAVAAFAELSGDGDALLLVMPSDHVILNENAFLEAITQSLPAALSGEIVTFGIAPHRAETGFGYIEIDEFRPGVSKVTRFTEKPDRETAEAYVRDRRHFWNAGIFLVRASTIAREIEQHAPLVAAACEAAVAGAFVEGKFLRLDCQHFLASPSISIDYAVLERSERVSVVEARMGWSDVGSWESVWEASAKDSDGNVLSGKAAVVNSRDCLIRNETDVPVAVLDAAELVVVVTAAGTLVVPRSSAQSTRGVQEALDGINPAVRPTP